MAKSRVGPEAVDRCLPDPCQRFRTRCQQRLAPPARPSHPTFHPLPRWRSSVIDPATYTITRATSDSSTLEVWTPPTDHAAVTSNAQRLRDRNLILTSKPCRWRLHRLFFDAILARYWIVTHTACVRHRTAVSRAPAMHVRCIVPAPVLTLAAGQRAAGEHGVLASGRSWTGKGSLPAGDLRRRCIAAILPPTSHRGHVTADCTETRSPACLLRFWVHEIAYAAGNDPTHAVPSDRWSLSGTSLRRTCIVRIVGRTPAGANASSEPGTSFPLR